jgi:predicted RNase H-like HicB family nuclease
MAYRFIAIIEHPEGSNYGGYFPSLPGTGAVADTREELVEMLRGVLVMHVHGMREGGEAIPASDEDEDTIEFSREEVAAGL